MGILDHDHSSDRNPLKVIEDLRRRVEELERAQPSGLFIAGTTTMEPPGHVNLSASYDYHIADYPVAFGRVCSLFLALPGLAAFWPMSAVRRDSAADQARDLAGGAYHLTNNNTALFGYDDLIPYVEFDGVDQYLSRADGGAADWADVLGTETHIVAAQRGLTIGGWFYFGAAAGSDEVLICKWHSGIAQRSYLIRREAGGLVRFYVSANGVAVTSVLSISTPPQDTWVFLVGRFDPSNEIKIWYNDETNTNVAAIPATVFDGTADFAIGAYSNPLLYLEGRASVCFLCTAALSDAIVGQAFQQSRALFGA